MILEREKKIRNEEKNRKLTYSEKKRRRRKSQDVIGCTDNARLKLVRRDKSGARWTNAHPAPAYSFEECYSGASHGGGKHARTSPPPPVGASTPPPHLHRHLRRRTQGSWVSTLILHAPISLHSHVHEVARTGLVVVLFHPHT